MKNKVISFLAVEKVAAVYCALTCVLMLIMMPRLVDPVGMTVMRVEWLAMTLCLAFAQRFTARFFASPDRERVGVGLHSSIFTFIRVSAQMAWLAVWYPDTYEFNRSFNNLDHLFAAADQSLFGCQPSLEFSQALPSAFWSEAFNLGYWSYFPMIGLLLVTIFILESRKPSTINPHPSSLNRPPWGTTGGSSPFLSVAATILTAFFLYYVIYIFLPVVGPQFYFQAVGISEIQQGHFPVLGTYFSSHTEMLPPPGWADGLFSRLVAMAHEAGERPTAAFPSSHIGISTLLLLLARRHAPKLLFVLVPLWALLCCATVYIQAHYLVDAIAGLISAPLALWAASRLVKRLH